MNDKAVVQHSEPARSVINEMAGRYGMERSAFVATLKGTIMPAKTDVSNEQLVAFLLVASKYSLNPFTKEIFAFPNRGGIQPIVSVDGWLKIINDHPDFDGMEFVDRFDDAGNLAAVTCRMFRKGREHPVEVTEYMDECRRATDVWQKWPKRMLRHKATIQAARYAFGFSGIVDPDEAERAADTDHATVVQMPRAKSERVTPVAEPAAPEVVDAEFSADTPPDDAPGVYISEAMQKVLFAAAKAAGISDEALLDKYPRIDTGNFAAIRAELKALAEAV